MIVSAGHDFKFTQAQADDSGVNLFQLLLSDSHDMIVDSYEGRQLKWQLP